jgi:hypothetical protein
MKLHGYEVIRDLMGDPELQKRLAKYMVLRCFRNSLLEELHSGTHRHRRRRLLRCIRHHAIRRAILVHLAMRDPLPNWNPPTLTSGSD